MSDNTLLFCDFVIKCLYKLVRRNEKGTPIPLLTTLQWVLLWEVDRMHVGELIKEAREKKGLTTTQLAEKVDVSQEYISHLENNQKENPSLEILKKIAIALDVSRFELLNMVDYLDEEAKCNVSFGEKLKSLRKLRKMSVRTLAETSSVSHSYLSQIENNKLNNPPKPDVIEKIANGLSEDDEANFEVLYYYLMEAAGYLKTGKQTDVSQDIKNVLKYNKLTYEDMEITQEQRDKILKIIDIVLG